jgi:hypothetical protein
MKRVAKILALGFLLWSFSHAVYADILYLKSGHSLEGIVVEETDEVVTFEVGGGKIDFNRSEVDHIERGNALGAKDKTVERFSSETPKTSLADRWKKWASRFSKEEKQKREKPEGKGQEKQDVRTMIFLMMFGTVLQFGVAGLTMKMLLAVTGHFVTYWEMLWFQLKLLLVGCLVAFVVSFAFLFLMAFLTKNQFEVNALFSLLLFVVPYTLTYYVLAKKDLDVGFIEAIPLSIVIGVSYVIVEKVLTDYGIVFPTSYLQQLRSLVNFGGAGS